MIYKREFNGINISHFNGAEEYEAFAHDNLLKCLEGTHGHTLKVIVEVQVNPYSTDQNWVIDDILLAEKVMSLHNKNLSIQPWFTKRKCRATTENIVLYLLEEIRAIAQDSSIISVTVFETPEISATETAEAHFNYGL